MFTLLLGFVLGALATIVAQVLGLFLLFNRFFNKPKKNFSQSPPPDHDPLQSLAFAPHKQGVVWVLEPDKVPKAKPEDKVSKEQKSKREICEVSPVKKNATIKDHSLILTDSDGFQETINLLDCTIVSVSASDLSSRKWAKKYPLKMENRNSVFYNGSRICYLYLNTSWEKESWCKALRLASCLDKERLNWFYRLRGEFHSYLTSLNAGYSLFMKPSVGLSSEPTDKACRLDGSSSKVRLFLKKLAKKASKSGIEYKDGGSSSLGRDEKKMGERSRSTQDLLSATGSGKTPLTEKSSNVLLDEDTVPSLLQSSINNTGSLRQIPEISDVDYDDKFGTDEGTLCWNLLTSRLFFDIKRSTKIKSSILARIQRTLSSMRTPSYIGGITCIDLDIGSLPPYIHSVRALPMDMNEVWAMEIDVEYAGGAILDIETRLEAPDLQKGMEDTSSESSSFGEANSDILEGFEYIGEELNLYGETNDEISKTGGADKLNGMKSLKSSNWKSTYASRWKAIVSSMANHVSQVPFSLKIKIASVRGILRLHIKPPPSDQLWFSFTSMPEINFNLESSVGEHKITSGHVALLLENRIKTAIRETLVLPNCGSVCIPWMLAEKDDWVPRKVAPFMWSSREAGSDIKTHDVSISQPGAAKPILEATRSSKQGSSHHPQNRLQIPNNMAGVQLPIHESLGELASSSQSSQSQYPNSQPLQDLRTPLLSSDEPHKMYSTSRPESPDCQPLSEAVVTKQISFSEDVNPKRVGRKARMIDLGKKMGEKLEEKKRNIEERGRHIVEKMRGPS